MYNNSLWIDFYPLCGVELMLDTEIKLNAKSKCVFGSLNSIIAVLLCHITTLSLCCVSLLDRYLIFLCSALILYFWQWCRLYKCTLAVNHSESCWIKASYKCVYYYYCMFTKDTRVKYVWIDLAILNFLKKKIHFSVKKNQKKLTVLIFNIFQMKNTWLWITSWTS